MMGYQSITLSNCDGECRLVCLKIARKLAMESDTSIPTSNNFQLKYYSVGYLLCHFVNCTSGVWCSSDVFYFYDKCGFLISIRSVLIFDIDFIPIVDDGNLHLTSTFLL